MAVDQEGKTFLLDAGFQLFSRGMYPVFTRLLSLLGVPLRDYPMTAPLTRPGTARAVLMPPLRGGRVVWSGLQPASLLDLVQFAIALAHAGKLFAAGDTATTLAQFVEPLWLTRGFRDGFLYPFLLAAHGVAAEVQRGYSAYDVLSYAYHNRPIGFTSRRWTDIVGGTGAYIAALAGQLRRTTVLRAAAVRAVRRRGEGVLVADAAGAIAAFDHVVLATSAPDAAQILAASGEHAAVREQLDRLTTFETRIAIHGDTRLMPPDRRHWSVVNIRHDGHHSASTVWNPRRTGGRPIFKSWVTLAPGPPEPLYALHTYRHLHVTPAVFAAQAAQRAWQGRNNLWLAGMYTGGIDRHESAVLSALAVVERLAPESPRLVALG